MAVANDHALVSLRPLHRKALKQYMENEKTRADQRAAIRAEAKDERATLKAKGFNMKALAQAVAEVRRDDSDDPDLKEARDLYVDALARG